MRSFSMRRQQERSCKLPDLSRSVQTTFSISRRSSFRSSVFWKACSINCPLGASTPCSPECPHSGAAGYVWKGRAPRHLGNQSSIRKWYSQGPQLLVSSVHLDQRGGHV